MIYELWTFAPIYLIPELIRRGAKNITKEITLLGMHTRILFRITYEAEEAIRID